jgi:hypothetical protein
MAMFSMKNSLLRSGRRELPAASVVGGWGPPQIGGNVGPELVSELVQQPDEKLRLSP